ncbi:MAG: tetratricopeptide repeat protein [Cyclobacteriaceae bacterium]|nr:tetratricopeptide repeat protein [Cyclobacteriaceae bacterium]
MAQDLSDINLANEYYTMGELEKAKEIYEKLSKNSRNIALIHKNYFEILLSTNDFKSAEKYIDKNIRDFPDNVFYVVDKGIIYGRQGELKKENEYYDKLINEIGGDERKLRLTAQYFIRNQKLEYAVQSYEAGRLVQKDPYLYAVELATVYRLLNEKDKMVREYLNFVNRSPNNLPYVKNVLQNFLTEEEDLGSFENMMYDLIQKEPENEVYAELIIWVNIQQRNFYGAFLQARAYDLKTGKDGNKILEVGMIALENKDYDSALDIFDYLTKHYKQAYIYPIAKRYKINSREELVKNTFPVDVKEIRILANDYAQLVHELGINSRTAEALLSKARLHAFYLDEQDSAIEILNTIISIPRVSPELQARCKLDLGDIYLLSGEHWESALLYAQVEKSRKETPIGYEAKLRSAKLSYFKGDFVLAQEHLDVLKEATTREISNDAIHLSLLIKDNVGLDTSDFLMRKYANIELMLFQNKKLEALDSLNRMFQEYKGARLTDEILWLQSKIYMEMGEFEKAIQLLEIILSDYPDDIFGDDAFFRIAEIYDYHLKDIEKSKELYQEFLKKYPGSVFAAEARKRFRTLRGDYVN